MAFSNKASSFVEQPQDSHEGRILLLLYSTEKLNCINTVQKEQVHHFYSMLCVISTFIRLIKR